MERFGELEELLQTCFWIPAIEKEVGFYEAWFNGVTKTQLQGCHCKQRKGNLGGHQL